MLFQLTPSRRATLMKSLSRLDVVFQLTPSRRATWIYRTIGEFFSFQLTPSRRATHRISMILSRQDVSTHALTEGDGDFPQLNRFYRSYFNSRPHGGRLSGAMRKQQNGSFQLTPSRRATSAPPALRPDNFYFNSRPHGGRHSIPAPMLLLPHFNSRPHGGRRHDGNCANI